MTSHLLRGCVLAGLFLEHAHVHGNLYGTSLAAIAAVRDAGKVCILDLDVQGAESVKRARLGAVFLFIAPPSMDELERRLRGRGTETEEKARLEKPLCPLDLLDCGAFVSIDSRCLLLRLPSG